MSRPDPTSAQPFLTAPSPERGVGAVVVIPTFNEALTLETLVQRVLALDDLFTVLIVDDGSTDGTAETAERLRQTYAARVGVLQRGAKYGLGSAYLDGFTCALAEGFSFICEMDADFSHNPDDLPRLVKACRAPALGAPPPADLAIGSRYVGGVRVMNWPLSRLILSYGAGVYTRAITRLPVKDVTAGFKCFRREVLEAIDFSRVRSTGYSFQIEMNYRAWKQGFRLHEVPIVFTERTEGQSKMTKAIVREAAGKVWQFRLLSLLGRL